MDLDDECTFISYVPTGFDSFTSQRDARLVLTRERSLLTNSSVTLYMGMFQIYVGRS